MLTRLTIFFTKIATNLDYDINRVLQFKCDIGSGLGHYIEQYLTC